MPVLGTKLHVPTPRRPLVGRDRLVAQLDGDAATVPRLVLVSAPASFEKTTLPTQWLGPARTGSTGAAHRVGERGAAWLSLDAAVADSLHRSGHWLDTLTYAVLADEWRRGREA